MGAGGGGRGGAGPPAGRAAVAALKTFSARGPAELPAEIFLRLEGAAGEVVAIPAAFGPGVSGELRGRVVAADPARADGPLVNAAVMPGAVSGARMCCRCARFGSLVCFVRRVPRRRALTMVMRVKSSDSIWCDLISSNSFFGLRRGPYPDRGVRARWQRIRGEGSGATGRRRHCGGRRSELRCVAVRCRDARTRTRGWKDGTDSWALIYLISSHFR